VKRWSFTATARTSAEIPLQNGEGGTEGAGWG
jgi:hypothetical protein